MHIWVVLAQWSLPSSLASEDHLASDGMVGQHIYLSNAMKALHNLANGLQKIVDLSNYTNRGCKLAPLTGGRPSICSQALTLMDDSRTLFSLLALNGRRKHQEEAAQALTTVSIMLSELINLYDTSTLRHVHNFASIIFFCGFRFAHSAKTPSLVGWPYRDQRRS